MDRPPEFARGRDRGPIGMARSWVDVLIWPREFFRTRVAPGDQAPGLTFVMAVVLVEEGTRYLLAPDTIPSIAGGGVVSALIALAVAVLLVAPAALHLVAAIQTLFLIALVDDRAGISETVQVVGYATAPCVLVGLPIPELRVVCTAYGAALLVIGVAEVHETSTRRALVTGTIPAALVFGYGFRGFDATATLLSRWYII